MIKLVDRKPGQLDLTISLRTVEQKSGNARDSSPCRSYRGVGRTEVWFNRERLAPQSAPLEA